MKLAVVDIGTNSIHCLIVQVDADLKFHVLDKVREMVRLGQSTFRTHRLDEDTQRRALEALVRFRRLAERRGVERYLAVATSAVREAENGGAFLQEVYERTGIHARVIKGGEEARLVFRAVQSVLPADDEPTLVVDLGGGSAEFACGTPRQLAWSTSLRLGVQRLEEVALREGEVTPETRRALVERLGKELAPVLKRARAAKAQRGWVTSGSGAATLRVLRARGQVDADGESLPRKHVETLDDELALLPRAERSQLPGLEPERLDQIVGAVAFFRVLMEQLDLDRLRISDRGLREGLVHDFLDDHGAELQWDQMEPNARRREVLQLADRFQYDAAHAHHVAQLAVGLFDATRDLHGLDEEARELLEYGALLHDVGYAVSESAHHKHSEYLVLHSLGAGFTEAEARCIAAIARYHRKAHPKKRHANWASLDPRDRELVRRTAALLRIADGLDRGHSHAVEAVKARAEGEVLVLEVHGEDAVDLELWAAKRKGDLFEATFGMELAFETGGPSPDPAEEVAPRARRVRREGGRHDADEDQRRA